MEYKPVLAGFGGGIVEGGLHEIYGYIDEKAGTQSQPLTKRYQTWLDVASTLVVGGVESMMYDSLPVMVDDALTGFMGAEGANMVYYAKALASKSPGLFKAIPKAQVSVNARPAVNAPAPSKKLIVTPQL